MRLSEEAQAEVLVATLDVRRKVQNRANLPYLNHKDPRRKVQSPENDEKTAFCVSEESSRSLGDTEWQCRKSLKRRPILVCESLVICKISLANHPRIIVKENHSTAFIRILQFVAENLTFIQSTNKKKDDVSKISRIIILTAMPITE